VQCQWPELSDAPAMLRLASSMRPPVQVLLQATEKSKDDLDRNVRQERSVNRGVVLAKKIVSDCHVQQSHVSHRVLGITPHSHAKRIQRLPWFSRI
jgi:hypothetical protein